MVNDALLVLALILLLSYAFRMQRLAEIEAWPQLPGIIDSENVSLLLHSGFRMDGTRVLYRTAMMIDLSLLSIDQRSSLHILYSAMFSLIGRLHRILSASNHQFNPCFLAWNLFTLSNHSL